MLGERNATNTEQRHFGSYVTKEVFSEVFRNAWVSSVKMSLFVNAFRESGICPLNPGAIVESKLAPSAPYSSVPLGIAPKPKLSSAAKKVTELESLMKPETLKLYEERLEELLSWASLRNGYLKCG